MSVNFFKESHKYLYWKACSNKLINPNNSDDVNNPHSNIDKRDTCQINTLSEQNITKRYVKNWS
jgi:hypothetical protein